MSEATFPAAPTPRSVRIAMRGGVAIAVGLIVWGALSVVGTGVGGLLATLLLAAAVPLAWHRAMAPHAYSIEGTAVRVHRHWLPDSRFEMRSPPERLTAVEVRSSRPGPADEGIGDAFARLSKRRVLRAVTDTRKGVHILIDRGGALVISPDDPDAFLRASGGEAFR